eukprot:47464-Chlamydomonas_euryale.AAC.1
MRRDAADGAPVPEDVLVRATQYYGGYGDTCSHPQRHVCPRPLWHVCPRPLWHVCPKSVRPMHATLNVATNPFIQSLHVHRFIHQHSTKSSTASSSIYLPPIRAASHCFLLSMGQPA